MIETDLQVIDQEEHSEKIEIRDGESKKFSIQKNEENCYYGNAKTYWSRVEPTIDGMLGKFQFNYGNSF